MKLVLRTRDPITDKDWIRLKPKGLEYAWCAIARVWYRVAPEFFSTKFSIGGAIKAALQVSLVIATVFIPFAFAKWLAKPMGVPDKDIPALTNFALYQAALIALVQFLKFFLAKTQAFKRAEKERLQSLFEISVALGQAIGVISEQIEKFAGTAEAAAKRDQFISNALKCIEATVKLCTGNLENERYCCVTLLTFEDGDRVMIRARSNIAGRPVGGLFPQVGTIAFAAGKYAHQCATIHNFKKATKMNRQNPLAYRALSIQQPPPYESILVFPLPPVEIPGQNQRRKGVVTIDTARPYEFLGQDAIILTRVQAYLDLLNLMLTNHNHGIVPEV